MQHNGWGSTLLLLRLLFYLAVVFTVIETGRVIAFLVKRKSARHRQQKLANLQSSTRRQAEVPVHRQLQFFVFPRLEVTIVLLSVPALAGAGSGEACLRVVADC